MSRATAIMALALAAAAPAAGTASAARPVATAISAATDHACALLSDGTVRCWGANRRGQLGNGTRTRSLTAVRVRGLADAKAISTGAETSCALIAGGTVKCWGDNRDGQAGDGTIAPRLTPVTVTGLGEAVAVATDWAGACALLADGTVRCWGDNLRGGLGNGTRSPSRTPVEVSGLSGVTAIGYRNEHGCALLTGGTVACWGWGGGEGQDSLAQDQPTAAVVPGVRDVAAIRADAFRDCALLDNGLPECWSAYARPAPVQRFGRVRAYAWNEDGQQTEHECAVMGDRTVRCYSPYPWVFQLGNGSSGRVKRPVTVSGIHAATAISAGDGYTCALLAAGGVRCWGRNTDGQLGDGTRKLRRRPVAVRGL
jgi:alpha-tubulin suppressor-like RCC1 family protein